MGREMEDHLAARDLFGQFRSIIEIALDQFEIQTRKIAPVAAWSNQSPDSVPIGQQRTRQIRAYEPGRPGHECQHSRCDSNSHNLYVNLAIVGSVEFGKQNVLPGSQLQFTVY